MWKIAAVVLLALSSLTTQCAEKSFITELLEFEAAKKAAFAHEEKKLWKKINWQTSAEAAMKLAKQQKKPVVVFILVREGGDPKSEQC